jgi:hypothetical protein
MPLPIFTQRGLLCPCKKGRQGNKALPQNNWPSVGEAEAARFPRPTAAGRSRSRQRHFSATVRPLVGNKEERMIRWWLHNEEASVSCNHHVLNRDHYCRQSKREPHVRILAFQLSTLSPMGIFIKTDKFPSQWNRAICALSRWMLSRGYRGSFVLSV